MSDSCINCIKTDQQFNPAVGSLSASARTNLLVAQLEMLILVLLALAIFLNLGMNLKHTNQNEFKDTLNISAIRSYTPGHVSLCLCFGSECNGRIWSCANEFLTGNHLSQNWVSSQNENARLIENADLSPATSLPLIDFLTPATVHTSAQTVSNSNVVLGSDSQQLPRLC